MQIPSVLLYKQQRHIRSLNKMKSSTLAEGQGLCDMMSDNLPPDALLPAYNGLVGIVSSPPSLESVQFLPLPEEDATLGVLHSVQENVNIASQQANFTHTFLKSLLTSIDSKDPVVANAWLETLLDVIDLLPKEVIREEILGLTVSKGQSQQVSSRLASCKLIGKISTKFESYVLKSEIVGVVQSLCQDVRGEVRGSMCSQLASVARGVGLNTTKSLILPELVDLCSDEEANVRLAGINTVVQMLPLVDQDTRANTLVPLVRKICERAFRVEDATLPVTAHHLGRICHGLHDDFEEDQRDWFLKFYCMLAKLGLPDAKKTDLGLMMPDLVAEVRSGEYEAECRQQCAYNLPAMIIFSGGPSGYRKHHLHDVLLSFVTDPSLPVRNTLALSFHRLCTLIGNEVSILRDAFLTLLRSENLEVTAAIVPNVSHILAAFNHHQIITHSSPQMEILELVGALKQGEETVGSSSNWRVHSEMLRQIAALALCLPPDLLFSEVVPLMILRMHTVRPIPCRQAAARTLLVFLRHMDLTEHQDQIYNTLVIEFGGGKSCHKRMLFLNICQMALDLLPLTLFKVHLFRPLLALHTDSVPNIRLKLVSHLPILKGILTLPADRQRLQELETVVGSLMMTEKDKDVSAAIGSVISELDGIELPESKRESPEGQEISEVTLDSVSEHGDAKGRFADPSAQEKKTVISSPLDAKKGIGSTVSARRSNGSGRIPSYVAAERRRSSSFAPALPPDESTVKRVSAIDPAADEFLVDAGIRFDAASLRPTRPRSPAQTLPPTRARLAAAAAAAAALGRHPSVSPVSGTSLPRASKIPVVGRCTDDCSPLPGTTPMVGGAKIRPRITTHRSGMRPTSVVAASTARGSPAMGGTRGKSLSHENLRPGDKVVPRHGPISSSAKTSPVSSRPSSPNILPPPSKGFVGSSSRVHGAEAGGKLKMMNSPAGSRCSSPGSEDGCRALRRAGSAASSPSSSRSSSPVGNEDTHLQRRNPKAISRVGHSVIGGGDARGVSSRPRQVSSSSSNPMIGATGRGCRGSKLPLPTSRK